MHQYGVTLSVLDTHKVSVLCEAGPVAGSFSILTGSVLACHYVFIQHYMM